MKQKMFAKIMPTKMGPMEMKRTEQKIISRTSPYTNISKMQMSNIFSCFIVFASVLSIVLYSVPGAFAAQPPVELGTAGDFAILANTGISNTGITTSIVGDIGVGPAVAATAITGFGLIMDSSNEFSTSNPTSLVTGRVYAYDYAVPTPAKMNTASLDMGAAFTDAQGRTHTTIVTELGAGDISGMTLTPGVSDGLYKWSSGLLINAGGSGDPNGVTLDCQGNANAVFIFQIAGDLTVGSGAKVTLIDCQAQNIFWQVAGQTTLGTASVFNGIILDQTAIVLNTGATLNGRALAQTAVTLDANTVSIPTLTPPINTTNTTGPVFIDANVNGILDSEEQSFDTIQDAVNAAVATDTVVVTAGTYNESVLVNKSLTLVGVGATKPVISGHSPTNYILNVDGTTGVVIDNFEIDGGSVNTFDYGVLVTNAGTTSSPVEIKNSAVKNVWNGGANGIGVETSGYVLVHNTGIYSFHKNGIRFIESSGKFYNNTVTGESVDGTSRVQNLVNLRGGSNVEIYGNTLSNAITDPLAIPTWDSTAILVSAYIDGIAVADSQANIHGNEISYSDTGIVVGSYYATPDASYANISNNNLHNLNWAINFEKSTSSAAIHGNKFTSVNKAVSVNDSNGGPVPPLPVINAENNWWGTNVESAIVALINGNVDYSPWYTGEDMTTVQTAAPAPVLNHIGSRSVTQGTWLNFTITATSPNGFNLTFAAVVIPAAASFTDNHDGTAMFSWMPGPGDVGVNNVNVTVTDGMKSSMETVAITVNAIQSPITIPTNPAVIRQAVNLGTAGNFVILSKSGISNTGTTSIVGNIGVSPAAATYITGFGPTLDASNEFATSSLVTGKIYAADYAPPTPINMGTAVSDMQTAYTDAAGRTNPTATELGAGNIGGMTLAPGLYKWSSGVTIPTDVTLDAQGNSNAVWIFQIAQNLDISSATKVILIGGAQAKNVFWQVAGQTTLGTTSVFNGNILDQTAIVLNTGATLNGRALAQTAVTLESNSVSMPAADAEPPATMQIAWKNANYNVTLSATGFNNTPVAYINYTLNDVPGQISGSSGNVLINTEGNNTLIFYAVDILGNVETPNTVYAPLDKTAPSVPSFTLSASSVSKGGTITGTCTADPDATTAITGIDTATAGTKTAVCTATDAAGNIATATATYTVKSGGSSRTTIDTSQSASFSAMTPGSHSVDFTTIGNTNTITDITNVDIETTGQATDVRITVTQLPGKPSGVSSPQMMEKVYGYLQIGHTNLDNSLIGYAKIRFKVDKAWMASNGVQVSQIALYRFTSDWDMLDTMMISQDSVYYYFKANSPGLSYFAIGTTANAEVETTPPTAPITTTIPQTPTEPQTTGLDNNGITPTGGIPVTGQAINPSWWVIGLGLFAVIALVGVYVYFRDGKNPKNTRVHQ